MPGEAYLIYALMVLISMSLILSENVALANCSYEFSVNLTNVTPSANGSYVYNGIEIPSKFVRIFNSMLVNGTEVPIKSETRGCICDIIKCLSVCSSNLVLYYEQRNNLEGINDSFTKPISLKNGKDAMANLIFDFHHITHAPYCHTPLFDLSPERYPDSDQWTLYENGSLLRLSDMRLMSEMEYCFDVSEFEIDGNLYFLVNPSNCASDTLPNNLIINGYAMLFSVPFFVLTILYLYCCMNIEKPYSKSLISYLSALAVSYSLISFMIISKIKFEPITCQILGFIIYYTMICYLTWTCIISYDLWYSYSNFGATSSFLKYTIVGWMLPLIMTLLTAIAQMTIPDPDFQPGIVAISCTLDNTRWSALIYLYIPCILALIYTLTMYIRTLVFIKRSNDVVQQNYDADSTSFGVFLNFRLFSFMCLSWIVDIVSFFWQATHQKEKNSGVYLPDVLNASQGIFMFMTLIMHAKFWKNVCRRIEVKRKRARRASEIEMIPNRRN
ncbi:G-protein coupled receptor Mth2-like isoform X2 [Stomoxys calcitrans]|uniref:G-protein coupled receptor Mth2-like isoform X2 n=1 Tax=Stomoxys calcitrans TaxID=35570 RepID=UPI0027E3989F|nr:G-protein coupled receptor Mth2-like isoform X2 [Stomoxys calcitrans]